jgi:hypothetical protein
MEGWTTNPLLLHNRQSKPLSILFEATFHSNRATLYRHYATLVNLNRSRRFYWPNAAVRQMKLKTFKL